ncbi:hypothetical protein [Mesobacterium pallidum]|uniref:hypothetical protein n=1 Tax=Mesobacterium pallidum TaxID=2872037 RepID=UPI001EE32DE0|nr:hypothetical protein [Mesobacterium pallidum]
MAGKRGKGQAFNILVVGQAGRLEYEAALFAASLHAAAPDYPGRVVVAEPQPGPLWPGETRMSEPVRDLLAELDVEILPFESRHFGARYPHGNKIEALFALPPNQPFLFLDTDTLVLDDPARVPIDFDRPSASLRREGTWPKIELYGPGYEEIWGSLYTRFGLDFDSSKDLSQPVEYWQRYLYFNAGFFYYRCPHAFGRRFLEFALSIQGDPPPSLVCQSLDPWLDQVALPLVIHSLGGGRDALEPGWLDGRTTCHYRTLPLLYARESDGVVEVLERVTAPNRVKKVLKEYEPFRHMIYHKRGHKARALFDRSDLPRKEQGIRNRLRDAGLWER